LLVCAELNSGICGGNPHQRSGRAGEGMKECLVWVVSIRRCILEVFYDAQYYQVLVWWAPVRSRLAGSIALGSST
jgi:hypothetical protein